MDVTTGAGRVTRYGVADGRRRMRRTRADAERLGHDAARRTGRHAHAHAPQRRDAPDHDDSDKRFGAAVSRVRRQVTTAPSARSVTVNYAYGATLSAAAVRPDAAHDRHDGARRPHAPPTPARRGRSDDHPGGPPGTTTLDCPRAPIAIQTGDPARRAGADTVGTAPARSRGSRRAARHALRARRRRAPDGDRRRRQPRLEYAYDAADRLTERRYPDGRTYRYGRDGTAG